MSLEWVCTANVVPCQCPERAEPGAVALGVRAGLEEEEAWQWVRARNIGRVHCWQEDLQTGNEGRWEVTYLTGIIVVVADRVYSSWVSFQMWSLSTLKLSCNFLLLLSNFIRWSCWLLAQAEKFSMGGKNSFLPALEFSWKFPVWILTWPDLACEIWWDRSLRLWHWTKKSDNKTKRAWLTG